MRTRAALVGIRELVPVLFGLVSCAFPERTLVSPPAAEVRAVALRALALVDSTPLDSADFAVADALGWGSGLPDVELVIRDEAGAVVAVASTAADGTVLLPELAVGRYEVAGRRRLSEAERAAVSAFDAEAFIGTSSIVVGPDASADPLEVRLPVSRRRGLMLSEWGFNYARIAPLEYRFGGYAEIVNNGLQTEFLDGMVLAVAHSHLGHAPVPEGTFGWTCELARDFMEDPEGLWSTDLAQFPGSGGQYPVLPGQAVVVAMDAIDHRDLFPGMLDLSNADFELDGGPDNPAVPNVHNRSVRANVPHEHGPSWFSLLSASVVLARASDVSTYTRSAFPGSEIPTLRVPAGDVVDVFTTRSDWTSAQPGWQRCPRYVVPSIDRRLAQTLGDAGGDSYLSSSSRRVLYIDGGGRPILQHTRTSAADWVKSDRTPGVIVP